MKSRILRTAYLLIALGLSLFGMLSPGFSQGSDVGQEAAEIIRMDTSAFESLRRPAAVFDHDTHNETAGLDECSTCHHVWENGTLVADESSEDSPCAECHGITPGPDNTMALANAYHTQCRTCHIDQGKGPLLCGQCHKKETGVKGEAK